MLALACSRPWPKKWLRAAGSVLGLLAHAFSREARATALTNVERVYPALDDRQRRAFVRRCFATLGAALGETVALLFARTDYEPLPLTPEARALLESAISEGRGVVFVSAHLGPWELVASSLVAAGIPLVALARESYDPRFSRLYERLRRAHGVRVVWRARPGAARKILRTLRRREVLGVPMDLRSRVPSCDVPFLGHDAPTAIGPARIALRTRAAVVVGTAAAAERRFAASATGTSTALVVTATRIDCADLAADDTGARELTSRINGELSRRILDLPHAWVWMHSRWTPRSGV
jgi:KDO2-lipid IV(A) lauroyltransferase